MAMFPSMQVVKRHTLDPPISSAAVWDANFIGQFYTQFLPRDARNLDADHTFLIMAINLNDAAASPCLRLSIRALCMTRVARARGDDALIRQGRITYGHALTAMQYALWNQDAHWDDHALAAASCLELFEVRKRILVGLSKTCRFFVIFCLTRPRFICACLHH